jgi:hypothetical protein
MLLIREAAVEDLYEEKLLGVTSRDKDWTMFDFRHWMTFTSDYGSGSDSNKSFQQDGVGGCGTRWRSRWKYQQ